MAANNKRHFNWKDTNSDDGKCLFIITLPRRISLFNVKTSTWGRAISKKI